MQKLKNWCAREKICSIAYRQSDGKTTKISSEIVDLFTWQGKKYMLIEKGQLICMDRLVSVSDKFLND